MRPTITISTLQDLSDHGYRLEGNCLTCGRGRPLDLAKLIERFGPGYSYVNETRIRAALACTACGSRGGTLTIRPPGRD